MPHAGGPRIKIPLSVGQRFGEGVVIDPDVGTVNPRRVRLRCDCGNEYVAVKGNITNGATKSCGCRKRRRTGYRHHPLWNMWFAMIYRCENPKHRSYSRYGGRGIKVCERWHSFPVFLADIERLIGPRPEGCTLDREDNDGDYEPGNVRWVDDYVQAHNRSQSRKLSEEDLAACRVRWRAGETASALAREFKVASSTMSRRLRGAGAMPESSWDVLMCLANGWEASADAENSRYGTAFRICAGQLRETLAKLKGWAETL